MAAASVSDASISYRKEHTMKLTVIRAIPVTLVPAAAAFALSGIPRFKNAQHGIDAIVGEAAWLGFLLAALALIVLIAVALYRRHCRRPSVAART
jgi:hypothetical protein